MLQPFAGDRLRDRSRPAVLAVASLLLGVGFGMNAIVRSAAGYAAPTAVWTLGEVLFAPAASSFVADLAPVHLRGRYQGIFAMAFTGAFAAAPAVGGYVIAHAGARWLWLGCLATGLVIAAGSFKLRS